MIAALLALGCQPEAAAPPGAEVAVEVAPEAVDLGQVPLGESAWAEVVITNRGEAALTLVEASLEGADLFVNTGGNAEMDPGESQRVFVSWTPGAAGELDADLALSLEGAGALEVAVPLSGLAAEAAPGLWPEAVDLGQVGLGCEAEAVVALRNDGGLEAEVLSVALEGEGFALADPPALPLTLGPGEARDLAVRFAPSATGAAAAALEVWAEGTHSASLTAEGVAGPAREETFEVDEVQPVSLLIAINGEITPEGPYGERLDEALPALFEVLLDAGVPFRVAWLVREDGVMVGEAPYIDDSYGVDEAVAASRAMMAGANDYDNDYLFDTLYAGILESRGWVIDDPGWAGSRLNLVAISNDLEQSPISWVAFLDQCAALTEETTGELVVHAIGGPWPEGCVDAAPYAGFYEATLETGGVFLDYCAGDWGPHLEALGLASLGGNQASFPLAAAPAVETLAVEVDGEEWLTGWSYSEGAGAVVFERALPLGSSVVVRYQEAPGCP